MSREFKQQTTQGLIEVFKKFFGADWSPKIEHVFRFTVLALLDYPKATIMGIQKMLTDRAYRQQVITVIQDHVVKKFWANEFSSWSEKFDNEAIVPLVNKLGQFLSNEMVRNIVAQSKNKVDLEEIMNNENKNLTGNPEGVIIKPEITQNFAGIPLEDQAFNSDSFAEISEEDVIEDERFYLEPIE